MRFQRILQVHLLIDSEIIPEDRLSDLMKEANELVAILTASSITAPKRLSKEKLS
jgi:hypothetical protein